jgi:hypothetical protein
MATNVCVWSVFHQRNHVAGFLSRGMCVCRVNDELVDECLVSQVLAWIIFSPGMIFYPFIVIA